jgi:hypothetical protein
VDMNYHAANSHLFHSDQACALALYSTKWPQGYRCSRCDYQLCYRISTRRLPLFECRNCRHQSSLITDTIFENSKTPLSKWCHAMYLSSRSNGICATELSRTILVTYKTAWLILHKLRHAMVLADQCQRLTGIVRAHVDLYGSPYNPTVYLHPHEHPLIAGASIDEDENILYAKIKQVSSNHLQDAAVTPSGMDYFIQQHAEPGVISRKDICKLLNTRRYRPLSKVCKQAKYWLNDTFHGIGAKHLQAYLDEYCYRLNLQLNRQPIFTNLLQNCSSTPTITYSTLIKRTIYSKSYSNLSQAA